jgi:hypothetical protein
LLTRLNRDSCAVTFESTPTSLLAVGNGLANPLSFRAWAATRPA